MLLPVTTSVAASTLRVLAARQGAKVDRSTAEQPGKILHEVRDAAFGLGSDPLDSAERHLPPVYYGTIDATPLWALTLHDAWRWGLSPDEVEPLLPALERALTWMVEHGDADGDHLLEYVDESGSGLSNQGWKDSGDAVRRLDGSLAHPPVALCEVQGYAYAAARAGADLLEAVRPARHRPVAAWAEGTRREFTRRFWVEDAVGAFPAIALDGDKRPVVSLTSNIGHLLGTGILDAEQAGLVARRLVAPDMLTGFGIRTLSRDAAGYSPTGYHVGSVWTHDTAICLAGLAAEGRPETAQVLEAVVATLHAFGGRPPELFSGDPRSAYPVPVPYPAACRPQAWAAAAAVVVLSAATGLRPDVPAGRVDVAPVAPWPFGRTVVDGLSAGGDPLRVEVDRDGAPRSAGADADTASCPMTRRHRSTVRPQLRRGRLGSRADWRPAGDAAASANEPANGADLPGTAGGASGHRLPPRPGHVRSGCGRRRACLVAGLRPEPALAGPTRPRGGARGRVANDPCPGPSGGFRSAAAVPPGRGRPVGGRGLLPS
jgi:glycogen debranching enzyme